MNASNSDACASTWRWNRPAILALIGVLALAALPLGYVAIVAYGKLAWLGARPGEGVLGKVPEGAMRPLDGLCDGVSVTPGGIWLLGTRDGKVADFEFARNVINLRTLVDPDTAAAEAREKTSPSSESSLLPSWLNERERLTFVSRLDEAGVFKLIAVVPGTACLVASQDGRVVNLLTDLQPPRGEAGAEDRQTAVFSSEDQGLSWRWVAQGFMAKANGSASSLEAQWGRGSTVWAWGARFNRGEPFRSASGEVFADPTALFVSDDGGRTVERVAPSGATWLELDEVAAAAGVAPDSLMAATVFSKASVAQIGPDTAVVWHSFGYARELAGERTDPALVTLVARITRTGEGWKMGPLERKAGLFVDHVRDNGAGKIVAEVMRVEAGARGEIALLDAATLAWQPQGRLPNPFGPLGQWEGVDTLFAGKRMLVAKIDGSHLIRGRYLPFGDGRDSTVSASSLYASLDWGRSWRRLSMQEYHGALGIDGERNRVIWHKHDQDEGGDHVIRYYTLD